MNPAADRTGREAIWQNARRTADRLLLPVLVVVYAFAQHCLGWGPVVVTIVIGHLLATLCEAMMLATGIFHGVLPACLEQATDVGFSYGLACVTGLLSVAVPRGRWRLLYIAVLVVAWPWAVLLGPMPLLLIHPTFTDIGHTLALLTGLALSVLPGSRPGRDRRSESHVIQ